MSNLFGHRRGIFTLPLAVLLVISLLVVSMVIAPPATATAAGIATAESPVGDPTPFPWHPVSLHFLHPLATSPDPATRTGVRLSVLWGQSRSVSGVDLGLVATGTVADVRGLQMASFYAGVGGDLRGLGYTWGLHRVGRNVHGFQFGAVASWTEGVVHGLQSATLLGYTGNGFRGAQVSAFVTINDGSGRWAQLGSVASATVGDFLGAQFSGILNYTGETLSGSQVAFFNHAGQLRGVQMGVINLAGRASGLQLGMVNVSEEMHGLPVGLVNLSDDGIAELVVYATTVSLANAGLRTEVNGWRSTLAGGWYEWDARQSRAGSLSWHFGRLLWGDRQRNLGLDLGLVHLIPVHVGKRAGERLHPSWQMRLTGDWMVGERWGLHGALGIASRAEAYDAESESETLLAAGVVWR